MPPILNIRFLCPEKMKPILFLGALLACTASLLAQAPEPVKEIHKALNAAAKEQKMAFILLGRASCANCNATKGMIHDGKIPVTATDYVMADLNIDDAKTEGDFMRKFGKEKFGEILPFVVVTDSHGKALASSGGYKKVDQWNTLLADARAKMAKSSASRPGPASGDPNWPFKSAKPQ
jgi:thioredoxin-related protein